MAYHHHHQNVYHDHHLNSTTTPCCCHPTLPPQQPQPQPQPPSPISSYDPFLISTIISQLIQTQPSQNSLYTHNHPSICPNQAYPFPQPTHSHPGSNPFLSSLIYRIDKLETSFRHLSLSSSGFYPKDYLKDAAARVIQTCFRAFLVRRSRTLRGVKELANIMSIVNCLKSSFSVDGLVDYNYLSRKAMNLLLVVDSIQGDDKMIRDSKKSITRELVQFLEMIDGVCVKRHQVMTRKIRSMRFVRDDITRHGCNRRRYSEGVEGSKGQNVDYEEKKLIANLRERVERIGKMSRELKEEEVTDDGNEEYEDLSDDDSGTSNHIQRKDSLNNGVTIHKSLPQARGLKGQNMNDEGKTIIANLRNRVERIDKMSRALEAEEVANYLTERFEHPADEDRCTSNQIRSNHGPNNDRTINKNMHYSEGKEHVCFVEDGNMIGVYNADRNKIISAREVEGNEDCTKGRQDEEGQSDEERSTKSSEDLDSSRNYEVQGKQSHDKEFSFPAAVTPKMGPRAEFRTRKAGVKIAG